MRSMRKIPSTCRAIAAAILFVISPLAVSGQSLPGFPDINPMRDVAAMLDRARTQIFTNPDPRISVLPIPPGPKTMTVFNAACELEQISKCLATYSAATQCVDRLRRIEGAIKANNRAEHIKPRLADSFGGQTKYGKSLVEEHAQQTGMPYPQGCVAGYPHVVDRQDCALAGKVAPQCVTEVPIYDPEVQTRQLNEWLKMLIDTGIIKPDGNG